MEEIGIASFKAKSSRTKKMRSASSSLTRRRRHLLAGLLTASSSVSADTASSAAMGGVDIENVIELSNENLDLAKTSAKVAALAESSAKAAAKAVAEFPQVLADIESAVEAAAKQSALGTLADIQKAAKEQLAAASKQMGKSASSMNKAKEVADAVAPFHEALVTAQQHVMFYRQRALEYDTAARALVVEMQKPWITGDWLTKENMEKQQAQLEKESESYAARAAEIQRSFASYRDGAAAAAAGVAA
ncbi:unnamed protein product [Amoebophrya sp. A25]|nr:unnamed protein product [Amoebophrya sp. A25]|eukprot:GSA25T00012506001.1